MKSVIRWAVKSTPAMNMIMITVLLLGLLAGISLRRETFPSFELEIVLVAVPYPGASPDEVEEGICQKIEESVRSVEGIKKITSIASENSGNVVIELRSDIEDVQKTLAEIESAVDRIPSFPDLAEDPVIQQVTMRRTAIRVAVLAEDSASAGLTPIESELALRELTERVRDDLLAIKEVSQAEIGGAKSYQIDVELSEDTLRKYGLTLQQVAMILRRENLELPGGKLKTESSEVLLRGKNKQVSGEEIRNIPLVTDKNGVVLTIGDLGTVSDDFEDTTAISKVNGQPGLVVDVQATDNEDMIAITEAVRQYVEQAETPAGYSLLVWDDQSVDVKDRLDLLIRNGGQGLLLVFLVLACFLEFQLAFWVALGIPVSILGACGVLWYSGQTLNMLSMFSFLMALGIVVDDAIVIGENIFAHREQGKSFLQAAIDGTVEVVPSVTASVTTTVIAFMPMFFVTGVMGKFFAVMPLAIIAMLIISLVESTFILPCHLGHDPHDEKPIYIVRLWHMQKSWPLWMRLLLLLPIAYPIRNIYVILFGGDIPLAVEIVAHTPAGLLPIYLDALFFFVVNPLRPIFGFLNKHTSRLLDFIINRIYLPVLHFTLRSPSIFLATCFSLLLFSFGFVSNGTVPWVFFPKLDAPQLQGKVYFPNGTPSSITVAATEKIEQAILDINDEYEQKYGSPLVRVTHPKVGSIAADNPGSAEGGADGSHVGSVRVELVPNTDREITSQQVTKMWRERAGVFAGAETVTFGTNSMGPGGAPIEFKLLAKSRDMQKLEEVVEKAKSELRQKPGVFDVSDDSRPGKWEYQLTVKDDAKSLGVSQQALAATVRSAYYGEEVMRLQRGRHEVKLMVRYPPDERQSLANFSDLRIDGPNGEKIPLDKVAQVTVARSYSEVNRLDQQRSITVTADVDNAVTTGSNILREYRPFIDSLVAEYPEVRVRWEGQAEQTQESVSSLMVGFLVALVAMFVLLTFQFNAYLQPLIILSVIPFGAIGAIWGHFFLGLPLTLFSVLGLVALTGVVVNDSIVLVDFINAKLRAGAPVRQAVLEAGVRRFRPVLLTSATTVAGLLPILTETSFQAQLLIPMATSLAFGLMLATALVLLLVPTFYLLYAMMTGKDDGIEVDPEQIINGDSNGDESLIDRDPEESTALTTETVSGGMIPATATRRPE